MLFKSVELKNLTYFVTELEKAFQHSDSANQQKDIQQLSLLLHDLADRLGEQFAKKVIVERKSLPVDDNIYPIRSVVLGLMELYKTQKTSIGNSPPMTQELLAMIAYDYWELMFTLNRFEKQKMERADKDQHKKLLQDWHDTSTTGSLGFIGVRFYLDCAIEAIEQYDEIEHWDDFVFGLFSLFKSKNKEGMLRLIQSLNRQRPKLWYANVYGLHLAQHFSRQTNKGDVFFQKLFKDFLNPKLDKLDKHSKADESVAEAVAAAQPTAASAAAAETAKVDHPVLLKSVARVTTQVDWHIACRAAFFLSEQILLNNTPTEWWLALVRKT